MKKITFGFIWLVSFLLLLLVLDQFLLRYPGFNTPLLDDFQHFYQDLRQRVIAVETSPQPHTIQGVISASKEPVDGTGVVQQAYKVYEKIARQEEPAPVRYIYLDEQNTLNFADSLEDIPLELRSSARKLDQ
ncbi:MAG: hypothetical protein B6I36_09345 [Desulfobacteraceae bacterium 4572_35.1]|nr:MAG: hypothetical protein B6I36_09345 [Desulfobacteraceae bacterium 4572_35.1]